MQKNITLEHPTISELIRDLATLTNYVRVPSFPAMLDDFLSKLCHFDTITIITYKKALKPILIHPQDPAQQSAALRFYLSKAYLLDPVFNGIQMGISPGIYRLADLSPDSFEDTEYYQTCYRDFDLVDEINLIIPLNKDTRCAISLGRKKAIGSIRRTELNHLKSLFPMIDALVCQFWLSQESEYVEKTTSSGPLNYALKTFARGVLTNREQEVLELLLRGHSSKSIADLLEISAGTVKVHRKNIHSRLNTSTQSEIFTLFLTHLDHLDETRRAS